MKTGEPVESLSLSKILVLYMRKYQITYKNLLFMVTNQESCIRSVLFCYVKSLFINCGDAEEHSIVVM